MAVPTLIMIDGFEYGINPFVATTDDSGGICTAAGNPSVIICDSTVKRSGGFSLKIAEDGATATRMVKTYAAPASRVTVGALYFRIAAAPAAASVFVDASTGARPTFRMDVAGTISALFNGGAAQTTAGTYADSNWHLLDWISNTVANPALLDWKIDGSAQTQVTRATAAADQTTIQFGSATGAHNLTFWIDDFVLSGTAADYPIGSTTTPHSVLASLPTGDGTHNAGTNTIEDAAGTDIASPNAFGILDTWPPDAAVYIRQATADTTAYAEVTFANHDAAIGTIWDASPLVAFTSSTSAANEGATIVSYDNFSTPLEVYGTASARTSYASGTTSAFQYKTKNASTSDGIITRPAATWDTTSFDALKARVGHSNDVVGNPRWEAVMIQYAGVAGAAEGGQTEFVGTIPI